MWFLIDAADLDMVLRHVPEEQTARWRSLHRAIRPPSLASMAGSVVAQAARANTECRRDLRVRGEVHRACAAPVAGPDGRPLAIRLWVGTGDEEGENPPPIDAFVWDGAQWTLISAGTGGAILPPDHHLLHGAWFLSRIVECEERDKLITAALDPQPETRWHGPMRVLTSDNARTTRVFGSFRYHQPHQLRCLILQIEQNRESGLVLPTYHNDAATGLLGGTTALIDIESMQIIEWLTPPLPGIAWRHHPSSRDTAPRPDKTEYNLTNTHLIHPDDMGHYLTAIMDLASGRAETGHAVVRLLTLDHHWQRTELHTIRLPNGLPRFLACLIRPAGDDQPLGPVS